jgi:hypothetical protein
VLYCVICTLRLQAIFYFTLTLINLVTYLLVYQFEDRVPGDRCPYLLVVISCPDDYKVKGTVLVSNYYYDF